MSTTPNPVTSVIANDWNWLKTHLVLLVLVIALGFGGVYGIETIVAKHDAAEATKDALILQQQTTLTKSIEDKLASDSTAHAAAEAQLTAQINADHDAMARRDAQVSQLIAKINIMQPPQLVADLQPKLHAGTATELSDGIKLDVAAARDVDEQITAGQTAQADVNTLKGEVAAQTTITANTKADLVTANKAIDGEKQKNVDQVSACKTETDKLKSDARKGKMKWFAIGYVAGLLTHAFIAK